MSMPTMAGKTVSKLVSVVFIVAFVAMFGKSILTDEYMREAFGALMGQLPFAKTITDAIVKIMGYHSDIPVYSTSSLVSDLLVLAMMATVTPFINASLERLFLHTPKFDNWRDQEDYFETVGYKLKEMGLAVLTAPFLAILSAWLTKLLLDFLSNQLGGAMSIIIGTLLLISFTALSLLPLLMGAVSVGTAITWRIIITFAGSMVNTMVTNCMCLFIYIAILTGSKMYIWSSVIAFFAVLVLLDIALSKLKLIIVK